jgi:hypothetical protein
LSDFQSVFGEALKPDPRVALPLPPEPETRATGPNRRFQFVVELVGMRTVPAAAASALLNDQWHRALGQPAVYCMAPGDDAWKSLVRTDSGAYDSLALAWNLVSPQGVLTNQAAAHLLQVAESFATHIQRRAIPLLPPTDVDRAVLDLKAIQESFDIGVEILMVPKGAEFLERDVWTNLASLGFELVSPGYFERSSSDGRPYLTVTPSGGAQAFTLAGVVAEVRHPGLNLGFSLPLSPIPTYSLDSMFHTAIFLSDRLNAAAFVDGDVLMNHQVQSEFSSNLLAAVRSLNAAGIDPGSSAAFAIFGD